MKLSIVIPVLNEASLLPVALGRLQVLRNSNCELILVDGGSSDGSASLSEGLVDCLVLSRPGRAAQMNAGAAKAAGETLIFLHIDTELPADMLEQMAGFTRSQAAWGFFPVTLRDSAWVFRVIEQAMNWRSSLTSIATGDQVHCVRRSVFEGIAGFADLELMEDVDISRRLKKVGRPHRFSSAVICSARKWRKHGVLKTVLLMWALRLAWFFGADTQTLNRIYYDDKRRVSS